MREAGHVARAEKLGLEKVGGTVDMAARALTEAERLSGGSPSLLGKHALLLAVGARYRRLRSSMLAAIERGRPPAVDFLNGEIVARGRKHRIATPFNLEAQGGARIAAGKLSSGMGAWRSFVGPRRGGGRAGLVASEARAYKGACGHGGSSPSCSDLPRRELGGLFVIAAVL